jgi:hypothetical protein
MLAMYRGMYGLSKDDLLKAAMLKLETTNNHYSDIFLVTAKAAGNEIKTQGSKSSGKPSKKLPKAGFDQLSSFIGAM